VEKIQTLIKEIYQKVPSHKLPTIFEVACMAFRSNELGSALIMT
jgi:hypothetical protein